MAGQAPEPPPEAVEVFGEQLPLARRYAELLATTGIDHGLVGPREKDRLWDRHLVNCAVVHPLLDEGSLVADIGSGAGLPGIVLAIVRPDLEVHLVEPLLRRTTWLTTAIGELGLANVTIHRGRAEEVSLQVPAVTARAVASLEKLMSWSFPLLSEGGRLLALKGEAAARELDEVAPVLEAEGVTHAELHLMAQELLPDPVRVVEIRRPDVLRSRPAAGKGRTPKTSQGSKTAQRSGAKRAGRGGYRGQRSGCNRSR